MKNWVLNGLSVFLLIAGLGIIFYPLVTSYLVEKEAQDVIRDFKKISEGEQPQNQKADEEEATTISGIDLINLYSDLREYNEEIYEDGQAVNDPFSYETPVLNLKEYGISDDVFGYIRIPRMNVEMPILLGATTENMAKGAVNLGMTSMPIGGVNTNAVIAGHRGYDGAAMFRDIESLKKGDLIFITNFWETMTYEVVKIKIILPTDIKEINIQEGKDLVTLLTCHPYTQNYQRYVVYCERTDDYEEEQTEKSNTGLELSYLLKLDKLSTSQRLIFAEKWVPIGIAMILLLVAVCSLILKRRHNRRGEQYNGKNRNP